MGAFDIATPGRLTIHHDFAAGTTVEGTEKGAAAHQALKAHRSWVWAPSAGAWLLRSSRNRQSKPQAIEEIERVLTDLGYTVERDIDDATPSVAEQEADLAERAERRADRLTERAAMVSAAAEVTRKKADDVFGNIPFGQPMLVDHHSYKADRNRRERAWRNLDKSAEQAGYAAELARRADTASRHVGARYNPITVGNRIEALEAKRRRVQRLLDGEGALEVYTDEHGTLCERLVVRPPEGEYAQRLSTRAADLDELITCWKDVYARLQAEGKALTIGPDTVAKGDFVRVRGHWYRVRRVNAKSVSVPSHVITAPKPGEREHTDTTPWREITDHKRAEDVPAEFAAAYETPGADRLRLRMPRFEECVMSDGADVQSKNNR